MQLDPVSKSGAVRDHIGDSERFDRLAVQAFPRLDVNRRLGGELESETYTV
jgi:hypothetical protein